MTSVGIIGATGYVGAELIRLLLAHGGVELKKISSVSYQGKSIEEIYPTMTQIFQHPLEDQETVISECDVIFAALPHGLSQPIAQKCAEKGAVFIDLGADFRLESKDEFEQWYGVEFLHKELHDAAVYGLCELYRENIKNTKIIANPGCYPTSVALGLCPALKNGLVQSGHIIIDSKSGVTGAGRGLSQNTHYAELNDNFYPYKVASHRHTPEIEQTLSNISGSRVSITFVPHLLPINRGIISTMYLKNNDSTPEQIRATYEQAYRGEKFVRLLPDGQTAAISRVKMTNYCDISLHFDKRTDTVVVISAIDNMVKGAAGQAIQNMNLVLGLPEDTGLNYMASTF